MSKVIEPVDILIPTCNNVKLLLDCINFITITRLSYPVNVIVVNNGHPASLNQIGEQPFLKIVQTGGQNLGWEGGLKEGLKHSKSKYVMFANDDIVVPQSQANWLQKMVGTFRNPNIGAVGPSSNFVTGPQHMLFQTVHQSIESTYLIGFCMLLDRSRLDEVGGVDDTLPGGDDFDLSIRLRKAGYKLIVRRDVFVYHYGCVTGNALHGPNTKPGGWNSPLMTEKTNIGIIRKHGFREWFKCVANYSYPGLTKGDDAEGTAIRKHVVGEKIVDLGCANNKTVPNAVGLDRVKKGTEIPLLNAVSEADVEGDVEGVLPFDDDSQDTVIARHILEHCIDPVATIKEWARIVAPGKRLVISVPDEMQVMSIPMNPEHVHAFTRDSLKNLCELTGLKTIQIEDSGAMSIVGVFEKNGIKEGKS